MNEFLSIPPPAERHRSRMSPRPPTSELHPVKYMMQILETPADFAAREQGEETSYRAAWRSYFHALVDAGVYVDGAPLKAIATATTVRLRDGKQLVQDGPFAETKEQLGGFMILELPSLDAALQWAARCPAAATGAVEIRPIDTGLHDSICEG